jgi:FKBP-type peptidyl-prolyl cis-trans isomerase
MDVVNNIAIGDTTRSITIVRVGTEAEKFIVNDETFKVLVDKQWKKVNDEKENKKSESEKFISSRYPGLISLPDGLRYKILIPGKGNKPSGASVLILKYDGRLINGLSFVSSSDNGKPVPGNEAAGFSHVMGKEGLVKGLEEALNDMKVGEKILLVIPPELGYGVKSAYYGKEMPGQKRFVISPGETLILEATLISITP